MRPLNEFIKPINEADTSVDGKLKANPIGPFGSSKEYASFVGDEWQKALKNKEFKSKLTKYIDTILSQGTQDQDLDELDIDVFEETGILWNGEVYNFKLIPGQIYDYDDVVLGIRLDDGHIAKDLDSGDYYMYNEHPGVDVNYPDIKSSSTKSSNLKKAGREVISIANNAVEELKDEIENS